MEFKWSKIPSGNQKQQSDLEVEILPILSPEHHKPLDVFFSLSWKINLVKQSNVYVQQNDGKFQTDEEQMKAFQRISCVMTVNKLPSVTKTEHL